MNQRISWKQLIMVIVLLSVMTACGGSSNKGESKTPNNDSGSNGTDGTISHNGTTYGTVKSPYTGKIWLDRHLGAARVCESFNDTACYGDYYQWGRNFDGHQDSTSGLTTKRATDYNNAGSQFISSNNYKFDWMAKTVDTDGRHRTDNWLKTDGSSVCPVGFRVPTFTELKAETLDSGVVNRGTAFSNFLRLPSAGVRYRTGSMHDVGSWGSMWTSSVNDGSCPCSYGVHFYASDIKWDDRDRRAYGRSVRCIKG